MRTVKTCVSFVALLVFVLISSCQSIKIEKRKYRKGFHIEFAKKSFTGSLHQREKAEVNEKNASSPQLSITTNTDHFTLQEKEKVLAENISVTPPTPSFERDRISKKVSSLSARKNDPEKKIKRRKYSPERKTNNPRNDFWFYLFPIGVFSLFNLQLLKSNKGKNIATHKRWARRNKTKARWKIAYYHVLVGVSAFGLAFTTKGLALNFLKEAGLITTFSSLLFGLFNEIFTRKKSDRNRRRNFFGVLLSMGGWILSWHVFRENAFTETYQANGFVIFGNFILTLLILCLAVFAFYNVAGLACSLSCNGYEGLSFIVFFGGSYLILFLTSLSLAHLWKKSNDQETKDKILRSASLIPLVIILILGLFALLAAAI